MNDYTEMEVYSQQSNTLQTHRNFFASATYRKIYSTIGIYVATYNGACVYVCTGT